MNKTALLRLGLALALSFATAGLGRALTDIGPWYYSLKLPDWKPPDASQSW